MPELMGVNITMEDIQTLLQRNPLAAEQVKNIALQRMLAAQQAELDKLRNGTEPKESLV